MQCQIRGNKEITSLSLFSSMSNMNVCMYVYFKILIYKFILSNQVYRPHLIFLLIFCFMLAVLVVRNKHMINLFTEPENDA